MPFRTVDSNIPPIGYSTKLLGHVSIKSHHKNREPQQSCNMEQIDDVNPEAVHPKCP